MGNRSPFPAARRKSGSGGTPCFGSIHLIDKSLTTHFVPTLEHQESTEVQPMGSATAFPAVNPEHKEKRVQGKEGFAAFAELLNTRFAVRIGGETTEGESAGPRIIKLELVSAVWKETGTTEGYSLLFRGPADSFLDQRIHRFSHEKMGDFGLFIVPVGKTGQGYEYQAIVNRLKR